MSLLGPACAIPRFPTNLHSQVHRAYYQVSGGLHLGPLVNGLRDLGPAATAMWWKEILGVGYRQPWISPAAIMQWEGKN